jgi:hypothetical protein
LIAAPISTVTCKIEEPDVKDANGEPVITRVLTLLLAEEY